MKMQEVRQLAKKLDVKIGGLGKVQAVREIQKAEGNFDCFARAESGYCDQSGCLFYEECIKLSTNGKAR